MSNIVRNLLFSQQDRSITPAKASKLYMQRVSNKALEDSPIEPTGQERYTGQTERASSAPAPTATTSSTPHMQQGSEQSLIEPPGQKAQFSQSERLLSAPALSALRELQSPEDSISDHTGHP
jgi:hypothetical protein